MDFRFQPVDDRKTWEEFLLEFSPQALFQSWLWGEVEKKAGHTVLRYGLFHGETLAAIAQIFVIRAKRGTYLHVRQGPVFRKQSNVYWEEFFRGVRRIAKEHHAWFVRVSPLVADTEAQNNLMDSLGLSPSPIHEVDAERCWVLDIDKSEEDLLNGMRKSTRYEIRKIKKMDITVTESTDVRDLSKFYSLYEETSKRHGFVTHSSITEEFSVFAAENNAVLYLGYFEKNLTASAIILFYGGQAIYHHGASVSNKIPVSYAIQWRAIAEAKKRGIPLYNFYGIAPEGKPNHPWNGLTLFKKGFGGREVVYVHARDLALSPLYIIPKAIDSIRKKLRGYE